MAKKSHYLCLSDGNCFMGSAFGAENFSEPGEVVFTTGMTGYVQSLTDPSFAGQILVFTYPLIGNYGVPHKKMQAKKLVANWESEKIWVKGVVISDKPSQPAYYQNYLSFSSWLQAQGVPGIYGVDTRRLTQLIRERGTLPGVISDSPSVKGVKLNMDHHVSQTSVVRAITYESGRPNGKTIALMDCGVKHGILRSLLNCGFRIIRVPWDADPMQVGDIDGVVCSNGPGNPKVCLQTVAHIRHVLQKKIPFLGICLGHQLLALAIGADTYKLTYGHRGLNQPVQNLLDDRAYVTSQNHGYAVSADSLPGSFQPWFVNLNDRTNEGMISEKSRAWSVQFHPEGYPGPDDTSWIFDLFKEKTL